MKKNMIGIAAGAVIVAAGALFATGSIAPQQELHMTNTGDKLPLVSTGHVLSGARGTGMLYAPTEVDNPVFRTTVSGLIGGAPVDYFDSRIATPTLDQLLGYQACMTWCNYAYFNNVAMGDVLADYLEAGGIVILGQWCYFSDQMNGLAGRIMTQYCPITASTSYGSGAYNMDGVQCVHAGVALYDTSYLDVATLVAGHVSDGTVSSSLSVAWNPDLPIWYSCGNTGAYYGTGDWATLTANMILCSGGACEGDVNGDDIVDVLDLLAVIAAWGNPGGPEDVNGDGIVDVLDLLVVIGAWGPCYPLGACCTPDGGCSDLNEIDCAIAGGDWYEGEECATFTCPELPMGACCVGDLCAETNLEYFCDLMAGTWWEGETCPEFDCPLIYCEAGSEYCGDEHIANVLFGAINNSSGCVSGYDDYTYLINPMQIGVGQTITITNGEYWSSDQTAVWIDFNHDGDFDDAGEAFQLGDPGGPVATGTITAPAGSYIGITTMRVRIDYSMVPAPCGIQYYGEVEDYSVDISP